MTPILATRQIPYSWGNKVAFLCKKILTVQTKLTYSNTNVTEFSRRAITWDESGHQGKPQRGGNFYFNHVT